MEHIPSGGQSIRQICNLGIKQHNEMKYLQIQCVTKDLRRLEQKISQFF